MIDIKPGQYIYACAENGEPTKYQIYAIQEAVDSTYIIDTTYHSGERRFTDKDIGAPEGAFLTQEELYQDMLNPRQLEECVRILKELKETANNIEIDFDKPPPVEFVDTTKISKKDIEITAHLLGVDLADGPDMTFYRDLIMEQQEQA